MPRENSSTTQQELVNKLRKIQSLANDCLKLFAQLQQFPNRTATDTKQMRGSEPQVHFALNERAFIKRYAKNADSGPKKFTLVLAYLSKGDKSKEIALNEIEQLWNRMKSKTLLGMKFNRFFPTTAKENGWVNSKKRGFYCLTDSWKEIFGND